MITRRTSMAPATTDWPVKRPTTRRWSGCRVTALNPAAPSCKGCSCDGCGGGRGSRRRTSSVAPRRNRAKTANTSPMSPVPIRIPAMAGPANAKAPQMTPATTFAAVSSSGVRASCGKSADCTGRVSVMLAATTAMRT